MDVGNALRNTSKGRIKYDKNWAEEGRAKEIFDSISEYSTNIKLSVSPKVLARIISEDQNKQKSEEKKNPVATTPNTPASEKKTKSQNGITEAYFYEQQTETELPILEYEEERLKSVQDAFESKKNEFDKKLLEIEQQLKQEYLFAKRQNELDAKRRAADVQKLEEAMLNEVREKEMLQREQYQTHVKTLSEKVLEAERRQKKIEEETKKREQEQTELKIQLHNCQNEAQDLVSKSMEKLGSCEYSNFLRIPIDERMKQMTEILNPINNLMEQAKVTELSIDDILNANYLVKASYYQFQDILNDIESAKVRYTSSQSFPSPKHTIDVVDRKSPEITSIETDTETMKEADVTVKPKEGKKKLLAQFIAPDAVEPYHKIMENLKRVENLALTIKSDPRNKKFRFELQKAINTPINSLSSNSGSQIKSKIVKLLTILSGNVPELRGRDMSDNSVAYNFCANLIAKQFVEQGYTQISAQHSTAFPIALAVLGVWSKKPDVGQLILSHFYTRCPYLVPYYPPRQEGQTDEEYFVSLGYELDDEGNLEDKHKFLSRISGFIRLYAAIIVSPLPPHSSTSPHPHGLAHAWKWLSRTLNLDPRPDITATVLFDFLDVAGHALQRTYGRQFRKILHVLCKEYFPKIKQVTPGGSGGPIERLETFLQQTVKRGHIEQPKGVLGPDFWNRSS
ncbi:hypothetical protein JTE90_009718 [Oedothorax gibbosus]|uniref:mRNA export factor GLE1 n=1 Tax=Oedothorax gibbosus TaxID=931172 RepID=A0AAV6V945_9ARAC|nr:hypothetical protein JTE90_009718 [Oedothorax gibbosus]